jgi:beta-lactamase class A
MLAAALAASLLFAAPAAQADTSTAALRREIARIAAESGGTVGVAAVHLETGRRVSLAGGERFPMQSVYKLRIALLVLRRVDEGGLRLDQRVPVRPADLRPNHSPLAERHPRGATLTVRELLRAMASESDNTASDLLLRLAGGPAAVTADLRAHGIAGVRVDRSEGRMGLELHGVAWAPERETRAVFDSLVSRQPAAAVRRAVERYLADPRDTATPDGMADLLAALHRGRFLRPASRAHLLRLLTGTRTGPNRIRGMLPAGTAVAHKTGTSGTFDGMTPVVNDVGIVTLPDGGHVALAVFVKRSTRGTEAGERAIARIARAVYDHWSAARR